MGQLPLERVAFGTPLKEDPVNWNWGEVRSKTVRSGIEWEFVEASCQYHNGLAERRVTVLKRTLDHLLANTLIQNKPTLGYADLQLLLGQKSNQPSNYDEEGELCNLEFLKEYLRNLLEA